MRSRFNVWNVLVLLVIAAVLLGFHPLNAQEAQSASPVLKEELAAVAKTAAAEATNKILEEKNLTAATESSKQASTESLSDMNTPIVSKTWDDKVINIINATATQAFHDVEVTEDLVKDFLYSPVGVLTVSIAVWEIVGKDFMSLGVGVICLIVVLVLIFRATRHVFLGHMILTKQEGKDKTYEHRAPLFLQDVDACFLYLFVHLVIVALFTILGIVTMCAGLGIG
jgi:hypothetical protein